jgi:N4-gp56 family major capsid protein
VTVTALDYGNYTQISKDLIQDTIDSGFDPSVTDRFAFLAAKTKDGLIEQVLSSAPNAVDMVGSTPTFRNASTTAATAATGVYTADAARLIVARLKAANVPTFDGQNYMAFIHPSVDADFRSSTDPAGWRYPQNYGMGDGLTGLITGEIGIFENVRYVVTNNASTTTFNGNTVYKTYVLGAEGVCGYELLPPQLVLNGTVIDPLDRKMVIGWKARLGYGIYRPEAIYAVFSTTNH